MAGFWKGEGRVHQVFARGPRLPGNGLLWKRSPERGWEVCVDKAGQECGSSSSLCFLARQNGKGWRVERELAREKAASPHLMYF